ELPSEARQFGADASDGIESDRSPRSLGDDDVEMSGAALFVGNREAGKAALVEVFEQIDVSRARGAALVQPARKHFERGFVDETQPFIDDHEDAVDVNV